ncbi:MAG TPA: hypothetical protein VE549_05030, partial [Myxococcaceae bacterium]|nr:hypothetical protein [Myxococcaceae bacterium]
MSRPQLRSSFARRVRGALVVALAAGTPAAVAFAANPRTTDGKSIFRFDTFGDEQLWTDRLRMHEVIEAAVSPRVALSVGLKVDAEPLPPDFLATRGLDDPATTLELIRLN